MKFRTPNIASLAGIVQRQLYPVILSPESVLQSLQKNCNDVEKTVEELRKSIAEPSFRKNANERMMSFQERKRLMILNAKRKYCEKNNIQI